MMAQAVRVLPWPTLMERLARGYVWRDGGGMGAMFQMVTEERMAKKGNRAWRAVEALMRRLKQISAASGSQLSVEVLRGVQAEAPATTRG
jgi:hypothetical protein